MQHCWVLLVVFLLSTMLEALGEWIWVSFAGIELLVEVFGFFIGFSPFGASPVGFVWHETGAANGFVLHSRRAMASMWVILKSTTCFSLLSSTHQSASFWISTLNSFFLVLSYSNF